MRRISFTLVDFNGNPIEKRTLTLGASVGSTYSETGYNEPVNNNKTNKH